MTGDIAVHRAQLNSIIDPIVTSADYDLEGLAVVRMGRRYVVRVTVDRDGGVSLDAIADLARDVSAAIDAAEATNGEFISGEYQLEVSSPGVDRPLTEPRHWRRNVGRLVRVKVAGHPTTGRVIASGDATVTLDVGGIHTEVAYADLGTGRVEVEFSRIDEVADEDMIEFVDSGFGDDDNGDEDEEDDGES